MDGMILKQDALLHIDVQCYGCKRTVAMSNTSESDGRRYCYRCLSMDSPTVLRKAGYWYQSTHTECVLCGAGGTEKVRVYDKPKPANVWEQHRYEQYVCGEHFM